MDRVVWGVAPSIATLYLDVGNECLWWGDQQIALTPRAYAVLRYLVEHRDELVKKEALLEAVWPDACVEEGQVKQFIAELRRLLHDDSRVPRFIQTVRGRGYRWIGDIELRGAALNLVPQSGAQGAPRPPLPGPRSARADVEPDAGARMADRRSVADLPDANRPGIAVLPFRNLGGDRGDDCLAEGLTEDVIDGLTRGRAMRVVSRRATLRFRDGGADARHIAAELGVGYVLEGSVWRRAGERRISASLVDAEHERTIWTERFESGGDDGFTFQDRTASGIVASIEPRVHEAELSRLARKTPARFDAYDCVLHASSLLYTFNEQDLSRAGAYLDRAISLDPESARAHAYKAWWYILRINEERSPNPARDTVLAEDAARRAMALDPMDAFVLAINAHVQALLQRQPELAAEVFDSSLRLNGNSAFAWGLSAVTHCYLGAPDEALGRLSTARQLSPFDPLNFMSASAAGLAEFLGGRYDRAIEWARKALLQNPSFVASHRTLTAALSHAGRSAEARTAAHRLLALDPKFRISSFAARYPLRRPDDLKRYVGGLRAAGLPD